MPLTNETSHQPHEVPERIQRSLEGEARHRVDEMSNVLQEEGWRKVDHDGKTYYHSAKHNRWYHLYDGSLYTHADTGWKKVEFRLSKTSKPAQEQPREMSRPASRDIFETELQRVESMKFRIGDKEISCTLSEHFTAAFFRKNSIHPSQMETYRRKVDDAAANMQRALSARPQWRGERILFTGQYFIADDKASGERLESNALYVLSQDLAWRATKASIDWLRHPDQDTYYELDADGKRKQHKVHYESKHDMAASYEVFTHIDGREGHIDMIRRDGNLATRETKKWDELADNWSSTDVRYYDGKNPSKNQRPSIIKIYRETMTMANNEVKPITVAMPVRDGSSQTGEHQNLKRGVYYVPEEGRAIGKYEQRVGSITEQKSEIEAYARSLALRLGSPEAIGAFVTSNFDFVYHEPRNALSAIKFQSDLPGTQDVQHPLKTLYLNAGDCEDFALLFKYLLGLLRPPVQSEVVLYDPSHYVAAYLEKVGDNAYHLCMLDTNGFNRIRNPKGSTTPFASEREAMAYIWRSASGAKSSVAWELQNLENRYGLYRGAVIPQDVAQRMEYLRGIMRDGGGVLALRPPQKRMPDGTKVDDIEGKIGEDGGLRFSTDWSYLVRKMY